MQPGSVTFIKVPDVMLQRINLVAKYVKFRHMITLIFRDKCDSSLPLLSVLDTSNNGPQILIWPIYPG